MTKNTSKTNMLEGKIVEVFIEAVTYRLQGNWQWDLYCNAIFCSDVILSLPAWFSGTSGIIHPDDLPEIKEKLFALKKTKSMSLQFRIITTYGEIKTLHGSHVFLADNDNPLSEQVSEQDVVKELRLIQLQRELDHYRAQNEIISTAERVNAIGTWYFNTATHVAWYSDNVYRIYGIPAQGLNAHLHTFFPFIHADDKALVTEAFDRAYDEQLPLHLQFRIISSDGREKYLHQSLQWSYSAKGERIISGLIKDETEEKLQEARLEDLINENYFQKQFVHTDEQAAAIGHWYTNLLTRKVVFSDNCFRLHGLKTQTPTSGFDTFIHFVHVDDQERVQEAYKKIRNEHLLPELEYRIIRTDGKTRYLRQQGKAVVIGGEIVVMGFLQDVTTQRLAEKNILELREAALLRRFSESEAEHMAKLGNWLWEIQTGKIIWSDGIYTLLGYKPQSIELTQKHIQKLVYTEDRKRFSDALNLVVKEKRETEFEFRLMRLGTIRHINASFKYKNYEGKDFFLATFRDSTEEYEMRRQLRERIQLTEFFMENIQDRAFITDSNNTVLLWNKACEEVYKIKRETAIGKNFFDVFPQSKNEEQIGLLNLVLKGETVFKEQLRSNSGNEYYDLRMLPLRNEQGQVLGVMHVLHDVTKEHRLQQNLTERLHFIESLLASTIDRIIVLDRNMNYQYWNHRAEMYYGVQKEEVIGKNILELFPAFIDDPSYGELRKALRGEIIHIPATQNLKEKKGYYETYLIPLRNEREEVTGILWITHDLSGEWQLQQDSKSSADLLQATMDASRDMIQVFEAVRNDDGEIIDFKWVLINHTTKEIYGDIIGKSLLATNPGVVEEGIFDTFKRVVETGIPDQRERYYVHEQFNGWFYQSAVKLNDGVATTTRDITQRKKAEQEILRLKDEIAQKATDKYYSLFNSIDEGFCIMELLFNEEGKLTDFVFREQNPAFDKHTGLGDVVGKRVSELLPNLKQHWISVYEHMAETGESLRHENYEPGVDRWYQTHHFLVGELGSPFVAVAFNDITEQKKAELALQKSEERKAFLLKLSDSLNAVADPAEIREVAVHLLGRLLVAGRAFYCEATSGSDPYAHHVYYAKEGTSGPVERHPRPAMGKDLCKKLAHGQTLVVNDISKADFLTSEDVQEYRTAGVQSFLAVPFFKAGSYIAGIVLQGFAPRTWTEADISITEETAERIWAAVEKARAEGALRANEERMSGLKEAYQSVVNGAPLADSLGLLSRVVVNEMAGEVRTAFYIANEEGTQLHTIRGAGTMPDSYADQIDGFLIGEDSLACGLAVPTGLPVLTTDVFEDPLWKPWVSIAEQYDYRGCWSFPVKTKDNKAVGAFAMYFHEPREATPRDLALTEVITQAASVIISNHTEKQQRVQAEAAIATDLAGMQRLYELYTKLATEKSLKTALEQIVATSADFLETDRGCIQLVRDDGRLELYAYLGYSANDLFIQHLLQEGAMPAYSGDGPGYSRWIISDIENFEPLFNTRDREVALASGIGAMQSTPLFNYKGELVGVLSNQFRQTTRPTDEQLKLIDLLAWLAADSIAQHQAGESLRQNEWQLRRFNERLEEQIAERTSELQKNLTILQHTEEMAQTGSWEYEIATTQFSWSKGMYDLFGLPQGTNVVPEVYLDFVLEEDRPSASRIVEHLKYSPAAFEEILRIRKDSAIRLLKVKSSVLYNEKGVAQKVIGVDLDITELQEAEEKVKESENLLEQTARATPDAINIFDFEKKQSIHLNNCLAEWTGITKEEMVRMGYQGRLELVHPEDREKLMEFNNGMFLAAVGETRTIEYRLQTKKGKTIWIRDRSKVFKTDKEGRPTHLLSVLQDFTEEVLLRNQLLDRTRYAETIIDTSVDRIMVYDTNFNIIGWNKRSEEMTGVRKDQAIGKNLFELFPKVKDDAVLVSAFTGSIAGQYVHLPPKKSTYTTTFYERFYVPLKDEAGHTYAVLNIMHDISDMVHQREELKELNKTLEKKNRELEEKNEEISSFAFIASHDLKEPLRKLYTFSDWLLQRERDSLSETGRQYIKKIANSVRRMDMLIEDVLVLAKIGSDRGVEMMVNLNAVLERVLGDMKDPIRQKGAEIIVEELPVIKGNSNQLFYLFKNLVSNAIKFQEEGNQPVLKITTERVEGSEIATSRSLEIQEYYKISFEDNGLGFEEKYVKKVFQVFQRLHNNKEFEGTGMGLAICRKIMENHSGFIRVLSEPGKGSVFSCYFPVL